MEALVKKELLLKGLDCANCAAKIEREASMLEEVSSASVDLISQKMVLNFENTENEKKIINDVEQIVKKYEPDVKVMDFKKASEVSEEDNQVRNTIIRLAIGGVLFLIGFVFKLSLPFELAIFFTSYIIVGYDVLLRAGKNILKGQVFDENFLMSLATIGAFGIKEFPEGVAVMLFYQVGELFQHLAVDSSRKSIEKLMDIRPDYANLKRGVKIVKVAPEAVKVKDLIIVKPGEKVPLDGFITKGSTSFDTSALTGEAMPREAETGDEVLSGLINKTGMITLQVTKEFGESTVSKILELVQNASSKKAPTENFITKFARVYTPIVVIAALLLAFLPPLFIQGTTFGTWINRALVFLVVSCPCALVISIPLGFFGGIGAASKEGILVKGSNYLEALKNVETVVFDKTGTITKGVFKVTKLVPSPSFSEEQLMEYATAAESFSNHPIAKSILNSYKGEIEKDKLQEFKEIAGLGLQVEYEGKEISAGNIKLMKKLGLNIIERIDMGTMVYVAVDKVYAGYIVISDEIKADTEVAIATLKNLGIKNSVMLTGDNNAVAEAVGKAVGMDEIYSELLPEGKVKIFEKLQSNKTKGKNIAFVGDGINDAPVLARADVGIAMGGIGSDAAIEAADVVIMTDEPSKIAAAISVSKYTSKIVWQNIVFCLAVKGILLALGAVGIASMWAAVFGDVGVALLCVLNSMRVLRWKSA